MWSGCIGLGQVHVKVIEPMQHVVAVSLEFAIGQQQLALGATVQR